MKILDKRAVQLLNEFVNLVSKKMSEQIEAQTQIDQGYYLDIYTPQQWFEWIAGGCKKYMRKPDGINASCNWVECLNGAGLAGCGICSARGTWWKKKCKSFEEIP